MLEQVLLSKKVLHVEAPLCVVGLTGQLSDPGPFIGHACGQRPAAVSASEQRWWADPLDRVSLSAQANCDVLGDLQAVTHSLLL